MLCQRKLSFFVGATVNYDTYLDMLESWLMERLNEEKSDDFIFVQDGAPPHWSLKVSQFLNTTFPDIWIGWSGQDDRVLMPWPSSSHTLRFLFVGVCGRLVYVPLSKDEDELKARITEAVAIIDNAMLECVWKELDIRLDMCCVTNRAYVKHL